MSSRPKRPAARLLVTDPGGRLLLFRFTPSDRAPFWCTPGGALDPGESFVDAARRELREETGLDVDVGSVIDTRYARFTTIEGVDVDATEQYFVVRAPHAHVDVTGHTELERQVMQTHCWFSPDELAVLPESWFPDDLLTMWALHCPYKGDGSDE